VAVLCARLLSSWQRHKPVEGREAVDSPSPPRRMPVNPDCSRLFSHSMLARGQFTMRTCNSFIPQASRHGTSCSCEIRILTLGRTVDWLDFPWVGEGFLSSSARLCSHRTLRRVGWWTRGWRLRVSFVWLESCVFLHGWFPPLAVALSLYRLNLGKRVYIHAELLLAKVVVGTASRGSLPPL